MRKIVIKLLCGIVGLLLLVSSCLGLSLIFPFSNFFAQITLSEEYNRGPSEEIIPYIHGVQEETDYTKLIIGDSVCHQIFNPLQEYNDVYMTVGSNQAVTIVGQYLLAEEFVKSHECVTDIYLVTTRLTGTGFGFKGIAYQYFIIPFTEAGILQKADDETRQVTEDRFGKFWINPTVVRMIDSSPMIKKLFLNLLVDGDYEDRELSLLYLEKFLVLCENNEIDFHLIYGPIKESSGEKLDVEHKMIKGLCNNEKVGELIDDYYDSVIFYPDEVFKDGSHFTEEYETHENLSEIVKEIQEKNGVLLDFKLVN